MQRTIVIGTLTALTVSGAAFGTDRIQFRQEFGPVSGQRHTASGPTTDFFGLGFSFGPVALDLVTGDNGVQNPLHEADTRTGTNPLYNGDERGSEIVGAISSISYEFGAVTADASDENIVHRDIATRNIVMTTDFGVFSSLDGEEFMFGTDAPRDDYFGAGPVTWVTTDLIRLYLDGDGSSSEFIDFNGTWFTDTLVPAPGGVALFGLGALSLTRRRR